MENIKIMILKHFKKYSDKYKDHLKGMQEKASEIDKEAIELALYYISHYKELTTLLSDECKRLHKEIYNLKQE